MLIRGWARPGGPLVGSHCIVGSLALTLCSEKEKQSAERYWGINYPHPYINVSFWIHLWYFERICLKKQQDTEPERIFILWPKSHPTRFWIPSYKIIILQIPLSKIMNPQIHTRWELEFASPLYTHVKICWSYNKLLLLFYILTGTKHSWWLQGLDKSGLFLQSQNCRDTLIF